jgi:hypothetical protein
MLCIEAYAESCKCGCSCAEKEVMLAVSSRICVVQAWVQLCREGGHTNATGEVRAVEIPRGW